MQPKSTLGAVLAVLGLQFQIHIASRFGQQDRTRCRFYNRLVTAAPHKLCTAKRIFD